MGVRGRGSGPPQVRLYVRDSVTPTVSFLYIVVVPLRWLWALSSFVGEGSCVGSDCDFEFWYNCGQSDGANRWEAGPH